MDKKILIGVIVILLIGAFVLFNGDADESVDVPQDNEEQVQQDVTEIIHEALNNDDSSICERIDDPGRRKACYQEFVVREARDADDPAVCEQIEDDVAVTACKERVYVYRAVATREEKWCEEVENKQRKEQCLGLLEDNQE